MADAKAGGKVEKKKTSKKWELYEKSGDKVSRKNPSCPKCGAGVFLAVHKDRKTCGACGYTEFASSEKNESKEEKK